MLAVLLTGQDKGSRGRTTQQTIFMHSSYQDDIQRSFHQEGHPSSHIHIYHHRETASESRDCFSYRIHFRKSPEVHRAWHTKHSLGLIIPATPPCVQHWGPLFHARKPTMPKEQVTMCSSLTLTQTSFVVQSKEKLNILWLCFGKVLPHVPLAF